MDDNNDVISNGTDDQQPSVRDSLESALQAHSTPDGGAAPAPGVGGGGNGAPAPVAGHGAAGSGPARDAAGAAPAAGTQLGQAGAPGASNVPGGAPAPLAAPASWKASLREYWTTLHPDVQREIYRREQDQYAREREAAPLKQFAQRFSEISAPYRALMEAEGGNPLDAYHDYLKAATLLRTGAPNDRAAFVAGLVQRFNVPLEALDAYLAQAMRNPQQFAYQQPQQAPQQQQPYHDPRLDALIANMEQMQGAEVRSGIDAFAADPKHEFFQDVRLTMADLMDAGAKRGIEMSLEEAYIRACQIEPEVKKVLDARAARGSVGDAARRLAAARHAASSLPASAAAPARASTAGLGANPSVRQSLEAALDTLSTAA